jgi:hypothetical protein
MKLYLKTSNYLYSYKKYKNCITFYRYLLLTINRISISYQKDSGQQLSPSNCYHKTTFLYIGIRILPHDCYRRQQHKLQLIYLKVVLKKRLWYQKIKGLQPP